MTAGEEQVPDDLVDIVRQFVADADSGSRERTVAWYVERFRALTTAAA